MTKKNDGTPKSAQDSYDLIVIELRNYTNSLRKTANTLNNADKELLMNISHLIDNMTNDINSRVNDNAAGDIKLYTDATSVLEALHQVITEPNENTAQQFSNCANHFKNQYLGDEQRNALFNARFLACLAAANLVFACILCFTPLAPLALLNLAAVALCTYVAFDSYKISASYDQATKTKVTDMSNAFDNLKLMNQKIKPDTKPKNESSQNQSSPRPSSR